MHDGSEELISRNKVSESHSDLLLKERVDIPPINNLKPAAVGNQSTPTLQLTPDDNRKEKEMEKGKEGKQQYSNSNRDLLFDCDIWKEGQLEGLSEIFLRSKMHSITHQSPSPLPQHQSLPSDYSTLNLNLKKVTDSSTESTFSPKLFSTSQEEKQKMKMNSNLNEEDIFDDKYRNYRNISGNMGSNSSSFFSIPIPKMRILLMSVGTFGDVQPFATLGVY